MMWYFGVSGTTRRFNERLGMSMMILLSAVLYGGLKCVVGPNICVLITRVSR